MLVKKQQLELEMKKTGLFQSGKEICQDCVLSLCLFDFYAEYIIWNAKMDETQAGIKISRRNNNFRYADDITLMAESKRTKEPFDEN